MPNITPLSELYKTEHSETVLSQLETIFYSSSARQEFNSDAERDHFRLKYFDWYRIHHADLVFVASNAHGEVLGYVCGTPNTNAAPELFELHPWLVQLTPHFESFQAHLHINLSETARGLGIGSSLTRVFENSMKSRGICGIHIVTSPNARNVGFYRKNSYNFEAVIQWKSAQLLFMGKQL